MDESLRLLFVNVGKRVIAYLPNLGAGLLLMGTGWLLAWLAKRLVIRICIVLRVERLVRVFRWGQDFAKADVRLAAFGFLGNLAFVAVLLVFVSMALDAMKLDLLSSALARGVSFIPRLLLAVATIGVGWILVGRLGASLERAMRKEHLPRASLLTRFAKLLMTLIFFAMALVELDIARLLVIVGFCVVLVTLSVIAVVVTALGGRDLARRILEVPGDRPGVPVDASPTRTDATNPPPAPDGG